MRLLLLRAGIVAASVLVSACAAPPAPPNIVFILIDDLGIEATNSYGSSGLEHADGRVTAYRQPNLDALAAAGMRLDFAFATPSCAPTRAQCLTGRYPFRTRITYPTLPHGPLAESEVTLAEALSAAGYRTGMAGKWNLRHGISAARATPEHREELERHIAAQGFAESHAFVGHTIDYGDTTDPERFAPSVTNRWACDFVKRAVQADERFFLMYSLGLVHFPFVPVPGGASAGPEPDTEPARREHRYLGMIEYADRMIGNLVRRIDELGIARDTVILCAGDNGTARGFRSRFHGRTVNGGKLTFKDTGSRVPFLVRWPGTVAAGSSYDGLTDFSDVFATLIEIAGATPLSDWPLVDGRSFRPQLLGASTHHREFVYCQMRERAFVRDREFKLVFDSPDDPAPELFDVRESPVGEVEIAPDKDDGASAAHRRSLREQFMRLRRAD